MRAPRVSGSLRPWGAPMVFGAIRRMGGFRSRWGRDSGRDPGGEDRSRWGDEGMVGSGSAVGSGVLRLAACLALLGLASLAGAAPAFGQGAGSEASTLLRLAPGPRALALGEAFVAVPDPLALEYNPAATAVGGLSASYQELPVGASAGAAGVTFAAGSAGVLGVSLRFVDYGTVDVYEPSPTLPIGEPTGWTATGGELSAVVGGGVALGPVRLGVAGRWLQLDVAGLSDDAFVADAGLLLEPFAGVRLGASIQGLGSEVEAGRAAPVLQTVRAGASVERWYGRYVKAILTAEGRRREARTAAGAGFELRGGTDRVEAALRVGYETRADPGDAYSELAFGGGVRLDALTVEFAYRALGPLGATRQVGLRYRF